MIEQRVRFMNRTVILLAMILLSPAGLDAMSQTGPIHVSHPVITKVVGSVEVQGKDDQSSWVPVDRGTLLLSGDILKTDSKSRARIRFASGTMELYEGTEIRIPNIGNRERWKDIRDIVVRQGTAFLNISAVEGEESFRFRTGNSQGRTGASMFSVSYLGDGTAVNVYKGAAQIVHEDKNGKRTSGLVSGSSMRVETWDGAWNIKRFDPERDIRKYKKQVLPSINMVTGLPARDPAAQWRKETERIWSENRNSEGNNDHGGSEGGGENPGEGPGEEPSPPGEEPSPPGEEPVY